MRLKENINCCNLIPSAEPDQMKSTGRNPLHKNTQAFQCAGQPARKGETAEYSCYNFVLLSLTVSYCLFMLW